MKKSLLPLVILLSALTTSIRSQAQNFFFENFNNGCTSNCLANGYTGANGAWTVTTIGVNSPTPNEWFVSCAENGMAVGNCGSGCIGGGDATLHLGSTANQLFAVLICPTGDCGAAYWAGMPPFDDATTNKRAESPSINCTNALCAPTLSFKYIYNGQPPFDYFMVEYFDGTTWSIIDNPPQTPICPSGQGQWTNYTLTLPASAIANPNIRIGFRWINNNDGNGADPSVAIDDISVSTPPPPDPDISIANTDLCVGQSTSITLNNIQAGVTYQWSYNGTVVYTGTNPPDYTATTAGTIEISVTASNSCGSVTLSQFINVANCGSIQAGIQLSASDVCLGDCIDINDASTGNIVSWEWVFTGATTSGSNDQNPGSVCFNTLGQQSVSLTVSDGTDQAFVSVFVNVNNCSNINADIQAGSTSVCQNDCIDFSDASTGTGITSWNWSFTGANIASSTSQNPGSICFTTLGQQTATLTISDGTNQSTATLTITVNNCSVPPPNAEFTIDVNPLCAGDFMNVFNTSVYEPGATFAWTFTGGSPSSSNQLNPPQVQYNTAGTYSVKLVVTNPDGQKDSLTLSLSVINCGTPPVASFTASNDTICSGQSVNFFNNSTAAAGATYSWTFPGGTPNSFTGANPPAITFNTAGTFTVKLKVTDSGGTDSTTLSITVQNCPVPVALFSASSINICRNDSVLFTDQSTNASTWNWTFNGGVPNSFVGQNPPYIVYPTAGVYTATLVVTDGAGLDSTYSLTITVTNCGAPIPAFSASQTSVCAGDCIQFFDQSTSNPQGWYWSFPGGIPSFSTQHNPPYICYNNPGVYPVTLRVFNNLGIDSTTIQAYIIVNPAAQVSTLFDSTTIILGESVTLVAGGGVSYVWYPDYFLSDDSIANPVATPIDTIIYNVVMTDLNGCTATKSVKVNVRPPNQVFVPNTFTPNGDAVNDFIKLYTTGAIEKVEFHIFDRWGNRVFYADDVSERWDGTYKGKDCNTGVYVYFYRVAFTDGRVIKGRGDITLIR